MGVLNLPSSSLHPFSPLSHNCKVKIHHPFIFVLEKLGEDSPFGLVYQVRIHLAPKESQAKIHRPPYKVRQRFTKSICFSSSRFTILSLTYILMGSLAISGLFPKIGGGSIIEHGTILKSVGNINRPKSNYNIQDPQLLDLLNSKMSQWNLNRSPFVKRRKVEQFLTHRPFSYPKVFLML